VLVVVRWEIFVPAFVKVTDAFGIVAELGSVTIPVTSPEVMDWPADGALNAISRHTAARATDFVLHIASP
jgi:hypothetical protein